MSTWQNRSGKPMPCVCGGSFVGPAALAMHKKTCEAVKSQTRERADAARPKSTRPTEHREIASELRQCIENDAMARESLRKAEADLSRMREFAGRTRADLEVARHAAASIGLQGSDAESVEAIRAWLRAVPK